MKKKKSKLGLRAIVQFVVLCVGASIIYQPIFAKNLFYNAFLEGFGVTNTQFGTMFSVYTLMTLLTYFLGGIVADKFSPRKLLTISFIATGVLAVIESTFPSYYISMAIFGGMGITTTLTFWAALIKATRQFGQTVGGESKALGTLEGGRGIVGIVINTICTFIFAQFAVITFGLRIVLLIYAVVLIVIGVLAWFAFDDKETEEKLVTHESTGKLIIECLKNPLVWVVSLMVMGSYAMTSTMGGYVTKIGTANFSITVQLAAYISLISTYFTPIGSFSGGWLGDRFGASKTMILGNIGMIIPGIVIILLPSTATMSIPFVVVYCIMVIFMGVVRGQFYAPLREANVPMYLSGTATGLIATIGYSSDLFLPVISGNLLDTMDQALATKYIIVILVGFGMFSIIASMIMLHFVNKNKKKLDQSEIVEESTL